MTMVRRSSFPKALFANYCRLSILLGSLFLLVVGFAATPLHSQTYTDLHDLDCTTDGCTPLYSGILAQGRDGNLYGTLESGGTFGSGTVFKITPAGAITTLHNFAGTDGAAALSGLTLGTDGNFYGTAYQGGANDVGTIFKITPAGVLTTLHSFNGADGGYPYSPPILGKNGSYYGVTSYGGAAYSISSSGMFKLLTTAIPFVSYAPLILASDGNFYGTSYQGGSSGVGTVFRMSATGAVKIVYNFDETHGSYPYGPVVQGSDGFLYGTTYGGGSIANPGGVVFKLSTAGAITILHEFDGTSTTDGYGPTPGLVAATDGNFYGATSNGNQGSAYGTLFKITKSGIYSLLYVFDSAHGATQFATSMQHTNGILYGLTYQGGNGGGVFYSLAAGISPFVSLITTAGTAGQTVEILGNGLTGTTKVTFGSASASFTVASDSYMTAVVPATGTTGGVIVTTPSGTLKSKQKFTVIPVISGFSPTSGPVGTQVTITGTGLTGASKVTFGGVRATVFTVTSATQVTATVPTGAVTGKIKITTAGGIATSPGTFTVN
jgi:uncharacterized repeat protein (TIGR03803 family)